MPHSPRSTPSRPARPFGAAARRFLRADSGATAIEYGLICALIFLSFVVGAKNYGTNLAIMYNNISGNVH